MATIQNNEIKNQQINKIKNVDFSLIPGADDFKDVKVKSPNKFFNAVMSASLLTIGLCLGAIIAWLLTNFS